MLCFFFTFQLLIFSFAVTKKVYDESIRFDKKIKIKIHKKIIIEDPDPQHRSFFIASIMRAILGPNFALLFQRVQYRVLDGKFSS